MYTFHWLVSNIGCDFPQQHFPIPNAHICASKQQIHLYPQAAKNCGTLRWLNKFVFKFR